MPRLERLALARHAIDRATERRRDSSWVERLWTDPGTRVLPLVDGRVPVTADHDALVFSEVGVVPAGERLFLGRDEDDVAYFAVAVADSDFEGPLAGLRDVGALLGAREAGLLVHAVALANWHTRHRFCAACGEPTGASASGDLRRCPRCAVEHFPRNDPAIIVLVTDEHDRCLLGHQPVWPQGRFSTLAGFVEPGESLEHAVIREVFEEAGVRVVDPEYAGSQPWPFPSSLMLGFFARAVEAHIEVDGEEIAEARWFSRDELRHAVDTAQVLLPGEVSIARQLIETWYGTSLSGSW